MYQDVENSLPTGLDMNVCMYVCISLYTPTHFNSISITTSLCEPPKIEPYKHSWTNPRR